MSQASKQIVSRWFRSFWGSPWNPRVIGDLATEAISVRDGLREPQSGRADVTAAMVEFREAFPDLAFRIVGDLVAEGDDVLARWTGGGTHTGPAFCGFRLGSLPAHSGRKMQISGITLFRLEDLRIAEERGQPDALTAMQQLGLLRVPDERAVPARIPLPPGWNRMPQGSKLL
jgi:predicted ester cyclase